MITRHKIDFMIRWLHMQFDKGCPLPSPCLVGLQLHLCSRFAQCPCKVNPIFSEELKLGEMNRLPQLKQLISSRF